MPLTCDDYQPRTRKRAICDGAIDWPLSKINAFRVAGGWEPLTEKPETTFTVQPKPKITLHAPPQPGHRRPDSSSSEPRVKQPGIRLKEEFAKWNAEECPICSGLAAQMDQWGAKGCRDHIAKIVDDIANRGREWFAQHFPKTNAMFVLSRSQVVRDLAIKLQIKRMVTKAITDTEAEESELKKKYIGRRDPDAAAGRFFESLKKEQSRLHAANRKAAKPDPDPFTETPVLHFGAHLWPVKNHWHWHVDLWNTLVGMINGKLIVIVATDKSSQSFAEVRERLHPSIEAIEIKNTIEGENPSFRILQTLVPTGKNDVLLYCHGKGVQDRTFRSPAVRSWTEAMYETVIFNQDAIIFRMGQGYKHFHSFRMFGSILANKHRWHPSGTFFAVRAKYLSGKPVRAGYGGVEAWSGDHFTADEAWCEVGNGTMCTDLYDSVKFEKLIQPQLDEWRMKKKSTCYV